ncbi:MAG: hypothetical protein C5S49_06760 [Candidatus Methanogaster sp.]|nr:MAG: hypothetical protein C5S49_06760 [ANME-2 cluster archaeon]
MRTEICIQIKLMSCGSETLCYGDTDRGIDGRAGRVSPFVDDGGVGGGFVPPKEYLLYFF